MTSTAMTVRAASAPTTMPDPDEWRGIVAIATTLANTKIVPRAYQGQRDDIIAAALLGRNIGLDVMQSLLYVHVIEGKPSLSAECMVALVRRAGHTIRAVQLDDNGAIVEGIRADTGERAQFAFTRENAQAAGLLSKDNWRGYFRSMAWARAASQLCRMLWPDVVMGMGYVPEELGADVDGDGTPVGATVKAADVPPALQAGQEPETVEEVAEADHDVEGPEEGAQAHLEAEDAQVVEDQAPAGVQVMTDGVTPATVVDQQGAAHQVAATIPGVTVGASSPPADPTTPAPVAPMDVDPYATPPADAPAAAADDPYATPPAPEPTPEQRHVNEGRDLFRKGWLWGSGKGGDPWNANDVDTGSLRWFVDQYESRDPKYADMDAKRKAWCVQELKRRNAEAAPAPQAAGKARNPETMTELDAAFQQAVAADGDDDLPLGLLNDDDTLTRQARYDMARVMAATGYATSVEHGLERIAGLEAKAKASGGELTAERARLNVAHFQANPVVPS